MSKEQVKAILDRVLTWPPERQEDAAKILMLMESQDYSVYRLTDEQVEEVRRRRSDSECATAHARGVQGAPQVVLQAAPGRMKVVSHASAARDLDEIIDWISQGNPIAAARIASGRGSSVLPLQACPT
ncbi:hypothetical protein [Bradyrhizobium sp. STM 3561]|uniref:hypothetical protein n=1 Tax=Bradyrhizobium sp. STM 3561 TaxID=578923 RepID=UPI0038907D1A